MCASAVELFIGFKKLLTIQLNLQFMKLVCTICCPNLATHDLHARVCGGTATCCPQRIQNSQSRDACMYDQQCVLTLFN